MNHVYVAVMEMVQFLYDMMHTYIKYWLACTEMNLYDADLFDMEA